MSTEANERLEKLIKFNQEDPNDPFILYGIALEYLKTDPDRSASYFDQLLEHHENYIPAYYHAANYFAEKGLRDKAEKIYLKGIQKTIEAGDNHTEKEIRNAYLNFQYDE